MYDNNEIEENKEEKLFAERKASCLLLKDLAIEYDEKLYAVKVQINIQNNLLTDKEKELSEHERTKVYNLDLFSPIYTKSQDEKDLFVSIEQIRQKIEELKIEQQQLNNKVMGLKLAASCLEDYNSTIFRKEQMQTIKTSDRRQNFNDNGLSILEAQEIERQRIARELHDTTVQNLTSLVHKTELCIKLIDIDATRAKLELTSMSNTIKTVINDMRGIIYNLKPMTLDDLGLTVTVERYANRLMDLHNINVIVHSNEETKEILPVIKLTLFRIIQEACNNVVKHASASIINIDIQYEERNVTVVIKDNGCGFIIELPNPDGGGHLSSFGLSIIRERISLLSGTVEIKSEKGLGTTVIVSAPLTIYEGDNNE